MKRAAAVALAVASACLDGKQPAPGPPAPAALLRQRPYSVQVPSRYSPSAPAPLLIALHGFGSSSGELESYWKLGPACDAHGVLYAPLDGQADRNGNQRWNAVPNSTLAPWDVEYIGAVIDDASAKYAVDPKRIYVTGFFNGAFMAHRAACDLSPKIAAIFSLAGQAPTAASECHPTAAVSVVEAHGDHDEVIAYDGSNGPSAHDTVSSWADRDGCTGALTDTSQRLDLVSDLAGAETRVDAFAGCPAGVAVELWTIAGGTHGPDLIVPRWGETLVAWLLAHPKQ